MTPTPTPLRLRALTVGDLLDETFRIYRAHFWLFAGLSIALALPTVALSVLAGTGSLVGSFLGVLANPSAGFAPSQPNTALNLLQYPVVIVLLPFQTGVLVAAAVMVCLGQPATMGGVLRQAFRRYGGLWVVNILVLIASISLLIPPLGVFLVVRLSLAIPALLAEGAGGVAALERSWRMTDRLFWRTFGILAVVLIANYVVTWSLTPLLYATAGLMPGLTLEIRGALLVIVTGLVGQIVVPIYSIGVTLVYFDIRVRNEAYDLEVEAYRLGAAAAASN